MFKRIDRKEWGDYICKDLVPVLDLLKTVYGVRVLSLDLENVKAPEVVIKIEGGMQLKFLDELKREFSPNGNLNIGENWVACREHFCSIQ